MVRAMFPGTFDPIHHGHIDIAVRATQIFDEVIMAVYDRPLKTLMFDPDERMALVLEAFKDTPGIRSGLQRTTMDLPARCRQGIMRAACILRF
jgi:pantetheine-phosphate adenylyltransferase